MYPLNPYCQYALRSQPPNMIIMQQEMVTSLRKANPPPTAPPSCGVQVNFSNPELISAVEGIDINNLNPSADTPKGIPKALRAQDQVSPALPFPSSSTKLKENRKRQRKQIKRAQHIQLTVSGTFNCCWLLGLCHESQGNILESFLCR